MCAGFKSIAVTQTTIQTGIAAGFALGGFVVALTGVNTALSIDAATFGFSAFLAWFWVRDRPAAASSAGASRSQLTEIAAGVRLVFGDRALRTLMLMGWLVTFYVVPMGLAAPYVADLRGSVAIPIATGLVFAAGPFGTAVGSVVFGRLVPQTARRRWMGPLTVGGLRRAAALRPADRLDRSLGDRRRFRGVRLLPTGGQCGICCRCTGRTARSGVRPGQRRHAGAAGPVDRAGGSGRYRAGHFTSGRYRHQRRPWGRAGWLPG
jgi:hypothetical protein